MVLLGKVKICFKTKRIMMRTNVEKATRSEGCEWFFFVSQSLLEHFSASMAMATRRAGRASEGLGASMA